jgi:hypothetical protein
MAMGRSKPRQQAMWVATSEIATSAAHPFYRRLNELLEKARFDFYAEQLCRRFYAAKRGRPSLAPGMYFRLLMIGYFEGIESERSGFGVDGGYAGSFDDFTQPAITARGDASGAVPLGAETVGRTRTAEG